jgi:hypothetical protein
LKRGAAPGRQGWREGFGQGEEACARKTKNIATEYHLPQTIPATSIVTFHDESEGDASGAEGEALLALAALPPAVAANSFLGHQTIIS